MLIAFVYWGRFWAVCFVDDCSFLAAKMIVMMKKKITEQRSK